MQELHNMMEEFVETKIGDILPKMEQYCQCEICRQDIKAYALNRLPAKYVHSEKGVIFQKFNALTMEADIELTKAVVLAVETIGKNPNHS